MTFGLPSFNEIVKGQIYLGNLSAALSPEVKKKLGITHIVSVCPEYPSTGPNHLAIVVEDTEYDNILIHLPKACQFIQSALDRGGRVLVHCVMGVSRSATVVAAYLMKTWKMSRTAAVRWIKQRRAQVHPNYGFIKQLETFAGCKYEPSCANPVYCKWKRQQERDVTQFLNHLVDTTVIIPNELLLSSEFPDDPWQAESLILDSGVTHVLSISPAEIPPATLSSLKQHHHMEIPDQRKDALLVALPGACRSVQDAIKSGGQVLVHSSVESTACIVVCAFLMSARNLSASEAFSQIEDALPLFNPTKSFSRHLELFEACKYRPTSDHPLVKEWVASGTSPTPSPVSGLPNTLGSIAEDIMGETALDMKAFDDALVAIQLRPRKGTSW
ncbi:putative dual specificity phosphatase, catalytic domain [Lyophyllum shimeji]|uniref:protein-tyrosine-phosphatase n=1 Tax=Lyophyllum shimeji TaxID=47721 RepID=A0A9P3PF36_LYOSH|nr:putative dual specificity phosphatase, catalytic domain [Lyophyllum shimeji]